MTRRRSLAGRALTAIALLVGFYVLVLALAAVLIVAPVLEWRFLGMLHFQIGLAPILGILLLWALVPRPARWEDPGVAFDAGSQPELWAMIERVARQTGQRVPADAYLLDDVNAFVVKRGGVLGFGGRRVIGVGVPLTMLLDEHELEAVIAHEFGHFTGGDTGLGPLVYQTRRVLGRAMETVGDGAIHGLFKGYAAFYLRHTQAISRAQERSADELAARLTSPETIATALARVEFGANAFKFYRATEYDPVIESGRRPPYLDGFGYALRSSAVTTYMERSRASDDEERGSVYDSHPPTRERIRALGVDVDRIPVTWPDHPAASQLRDHRKIEAELVRRHLSVEPESLAPVAWETAIDEIWLPQWRAQVARLLLPMSADMSPTSVPTSLDDLAYFGDLVFQAQGHRANRAVRSEYAQELVARYLTLAAVDAGFELRARPGEPMSLWRDGEQLRVLDDWPRVIAGEEMAATWRADVERNGITARVRDVAAPAPSQAGGAHPGAASAPAAPLEYQAQPPGGGKRVLAINGPQLSWGYESVHAGEVGSVRLREKWNQFGNVISYRFAIATPRGNMEIRLRGANGKAARAQQAEAISAALAWAERYVLPALVDRMIDYIDASGGIDVGDLHVSNAGIATKRAQASWGELAGMEKRQGDIVVYVRADNRDGRKKLGSVSTFADGGLALPQLVRALASLANVA